MNAVRQALHRLRGGPTPGDEVWVYSTVVRIIVAAQNTTCTICGSCYAARAVKSYRSVLFHWHI